MKSGSYQTLSPAEIELRVAADLRGALGRRGATIIHEGAPGRPDVVVDAGTFVIVIELAKRSGADAASEYLSIRAHRDCIEQETGKPTHLLFSCVKTPERIITAIRDENARREELRREGRVLFLCLEHLHLVLTRLGETPTDLYPNDRWNAWFHGWESIGEDEVALETLQRTVLFEDRQFEKEVQPLLLSRTQAGQERLRKDVRRLEDTLRLSNVTGYEAMRTLIFLMFVKLYEEKRAAEHKPNRFTAKGFVEYRNSLPTKAKHTHDGRTLHYLIENEIAVDPEIEATGILCGATLPDRITDKLLEDRVLKVLDRYRFRGTHLDALGAVFEAVARKAQKDTRIGQFFTPEPIVRFAVDVVEPGPTETVLDPAAGTGRFLSWSMARMLEHAHEVPRTAPEVVAKRIRENQLLGADADPWIVTIAKMNMYIHGDGKSNIQHENGLFLADAPIFHPSADGSRSLEGIIDVCLTNPPLGAMSYRTYAEDFVRRYPAVFPSPADWLRKRLPILPGEYREAQAIRNAEARIRIAEQKLEDARNAGDAAAESAARRQRASAEKARLEASTRLAAGEGTYVVSGNAAKGGALFLVAIKDYLRRVADPGAVEEWRGGRVGIIVDEAILNAPEYQETRRFIRTHFFVKGVFSFDRDAFWYQARTTAKTSLLYLVRKPDPAVRQREPIFYTHIEQIGFTRTGKATKTQLGGALADFKSFAEVIRASYRTNSFVEHTARQELAKLDMSVEARIHWPRPGSDDTARLDYAWEAARQVREKLPPHFLSLGDFVSEIVRVPPEDPSSIYQFATIDRNTGEVKPGRLDSTEYRLEDLRAIQEGDIVLSGIDVVHGAVGYAHENVQDHVVSKEFYTLRVPEHRLDTVDPRYLALLLRTPHARELISGTVTGTSNRTRIQDISAVLDIPLPPLPALREQQAIAERVESALRQRRSARIALNTALGAANEIW